MGRREPSDRPELFERARAALEKNIGRQVTHMEAFGNNEDVICAYLTVKTLEEHHEVLAEQRGLLKQIGDETAKTGKTTRTLSWVSIFVSALALAVALAAVITGAVWQRSQLPLLRDIADNTAALKVEASAMPAQGEPADNNRDRPGISEHGNGREPPAAGTERPGPNP